MAGVVALAVEDTRLHEMCKGCDKANTAKNICIAILYPKSMWTEGMCWVRHKDTDEYESQFQQARGGMPDPWRDPLAWLSATHPPSIRDKEAILPMPAPPAGKSSSRSRKKRKKHLPWSINILYEK